MCCNGEEQDMIGSCWLHYSNTETISISRLANCYSALSCAPQSNKHNNVIIVGHERALMTDQFVITRSPRRPAYVYEVYHWIDLTKVLIVASC